MKKIIISTIGSILILFVIWTIMAYIQYGEELVNYHLDLEQTFRQINMIFDDEVSGLNFIELFRGFKKDIDTINANSIVTKIREVLDINGYSTTSGFGLFLNAIEAIFDPIAMIANSLIVMVYIPITILSLIIYACNFIIGIWEFIFSPVFIPIVRNTIQMI